MVATDDFTGFSQALIRWQKSSGRHNLPWQVTDPYRRWLSEIMLQQTQVSVVADYFARFIAAYPTLKDLAQADEDDVMRLWAGLGYYSRARNLLACAKVLVRDWGGVFPQHVKDLMTLPGIGQSTAGAVASFSFDAQAPIMDGNVKRVFARVLALATPLEVAATQKTLWEFAQARVPQRIPASTTKPSWISAPLFARGRTLSAKPVQFAPGAKLLRSVNPFYFPCARKSALSRKKKPACSFTPTATGFGSQSGKETASGEVFGAYRRGPRVPGNRSQRSYIRSRTTDCMHGFTKLLGPTAKPTPGKVSGSPGATLKPRRLPLPSNGLFLPCVHNYPISSFPCSVKTPSRTI